MSSAASSGEALLREDRCFDPDPGVRKIARELFQSTKDLPIVSPHGHVDPRLLADDEPFPEPTTLLVKPDGSYTDRARAILAHTPMGRFGRPEDLVGIVQWLCSDAASFVTGTVIPVDGGFSVFSGV